MGLFDFYWILLIISGVLMLGLGASGFGRAGKGTRAINLIFGAGFVGYGLYLGLFFTGGTYIIFFKAFIVPVLLVVNAIRNRSAQSNAPAMRQQPPTWPPAPGQPGSVQPGPGQPQGQVPTTPWMVPGQATPNQAVGAPLYSPPASLTTPTLSSDDVLGR